MQVRQVYWTNHVLGCRFVLARKATFDENGEVRKVYRFQTCSPKHGGSQEGNRDPPLFS